MKPLMHYSPQYFRQALHPITIGLVGCGGNGSNMITQLARIHVSLKGLGLPGLMVTAYDDDTVSTANQGRQLFAKGDTGRNKAVVLIERINRFFGLDWEAHPVRFGCAEEELSYNLIISCVDSVTSRKQIAKKLKDQVENIYRYREDYSTPFYWMDLGNSQKTGQIILGTVEKIKQPRMRKTKPVGKLLTVLEKFPDLEKYENKQSQGPSCSMIEALKKQDLFINSLLAQYASQMLWELFKDDSLSHQGLFINLESLRIAPMPLA